MQIVHLLLDIVFYDLKSSLCVEVLTCLLSSYNDLYLVYDEFDEFCMMFVF